MLEEILDVCKKSEPIFSRAPAGYPKDGPYRPIYIIPDQTEPCIFATEPLELASFKLRPLERGNHKQLGAARRGR
ncbi:hypothetical protein UY3_15819 [Chelonia mydas]|uniref:Uncharacterized protein n=1 Tax=Chelonia mydas TaxID=8469 RepID=M7AR09_CHEMY|nr:hypothetical protein UY3_15819 [Chelonia mydas]